MENDRQFDSGSEIYHLFSDGYAGTMAGAGMMLAFECQCFFFSPLFSSGEGGNGASGW